MSQATEATQAKRRISTEQTIQLMRLEVESACRNGHPVTCMFLGLDGFVDSDSMLFRKTLMPLVFRELKAVSVAHDKRGLGIWTEAYILAIFPYTQPDEILSMGEELVAMASALAFEGQAEGQTVGVSIGISHNQHSGEEIDFQSMLQDAQGGQAMAENSGGGQVSSFRSMETEIDRLQSEVADQMREIEEIQRGMSSDEPDAGAQWGQQLVGRVIDMFQREPDKSPDSLRLEKEVVALLKYEMSNFTSSDLAGELKDSRNTIANLERRVEKLTVSLQRTEGELKRIASMKDIELGVSSIYRTVQGLSADDDQADAKRDMLKNIFEANLALHSALASKK